MNGLDWLKKQPSKTLKRQNKSHPEPSHACPIAFPVSPARRAPGWGLPGRATRLGHGNSELKAKEPEHSVFWREK